MTDRIGGGAFEDTDGDDVAELQDDHTDHQGGDLRNVGAGHVEQVHSDSIPTLVRLYKDDDGNAVAICRESDTVIDAGPAHETVIQSAIDHVYANHVDTSQNEKSTNPEGFIDGGGAVFDVAGSIEVYYLIGLRQLTLDAGGRNGFVPVRVVDHSDGTMPRAWYLKNVQVENTGDSHGFWFEGTAWATAEDIAARQCGDAGIYAKALVGTKFLRPKASYNDGDGFRYDDDANGAGNLTVIKGGIFSQNGDCGIDWRLRNQSKPSSRNSIIDCNFGGNTTTALRIQERFELGTIARNWFEGGSGIQFGTSAEGGNDYTVIKENRMGALSEIKVNHATGVIVEHNAASEGFTFDLTAGASADQTHFERNARVGTYTDNGTNTTRTQY